MDKNSFLSIVAPLVQAENQKRGNPLYSSVVIAQSILETGWGSSSLMMKAKAIFGIKAGVFWRGKVYNAKTKECYDGKNYTNIVDCFRAYDSFEDSIKDYFDLICNSKRYSGAINSSSPVACISAIKGGGYATSPTYIQNIMEIINSNNLEQYDHVETVENKVENSKTNEESTEESTEAATVEPTEETTEEIIENTTVENVEEIIENEPETEITTDDTN